jgi:hypothetical protein
MKYYFTTAALLLTGFSQLFSQNRIIQVETIYKDKGSYYTFIEPAKKTKLWYRLFIQFDSSRVINKGHVNMVSGENFNRARKWQILNDTLYFLFEAKTDRFFDPFAGLYDYYPMDTVFKITATGDGKFKHIRKYDLSWSLGSHKNHIGEAHRSLHSWYDYIHTKEVFTMFSSINDTILVIKDIVEHQEWPKVIERDHRYTFPHLGKFNVFKIDNGYYVLNDIGEFYLLQDSVPKMIGRLEYEDEKQVFYLKDNDTDRLSFNCRFIPLYPEYENLVGYIDPDHWLYNRYFEIKKKYMEELHELNRKTWK